MWSSRLGSGHLHICPRLLTLPKGGAWVVATDLECRSTRPLHICTPPCASTLLLMLQPAQSHPGTPSTPWWNGKATRSPASHLQPWPHWRQNATGEWRRQRPRTVQTWGNSCTCSAFNLHAINGVTSSANPAWCDLHALRTDWLPPQRRPPAQPDDLQGLHHLWLTQVGSPLHGQVHQAVGRPLPGAVRQVQHPRRAALGWMSNLCAASGVGMV